MSPPGVFVRPAREDDQAWVTSTWAHSLCFARETCECPQWTRGGKRAACGASRRLVDRITDNKGVLVAVAQKGERLVGWLAYSPVKPTPMIHYAYVRADERGNGIARMMAADAGIDAGKHCVYTMTGPSSKWIVPKYGKNVSHYPIEEYLS